MDPAPVQTLGLAQTPLITKPQFLNNLTAGTITRVDAGKETPDPLPPEGVRDQQLSRLRSVAPVMLVPADPKRKFRHGIALREPLKRGDPQMALGLEFEYPEDLPKARPVSKARKVPRTMASFSPGSVPKSNTSKP